MTRLAPEQQKTSVCLRNDVDGTKELIVVIRQCFNSLKVYGKEPEQVESIIQMFRMILADYPFEKILKAFALYLKTNTEMPAPADIANIIERGGKPPFDKSIYVSISKKHPEDRDSDDWQYMRDYEKFMVTGKF